MNWHLFTLLPLGEQIAWVAVLGVVLLILILNGYLNTTRTVWRGGLAWTIHTLRLRRKYETDEDSQQIENLTVEVLIPPQAGLSTTTVRGVAHRTARVVPFDEGVRRRERDALVTLSRRAGAR